MKALSVLAVVIIFTIAGCTDPAGPHSSVNTVTLTYSSASAQQATLTLTNSTDAPVYYLGFGKSHPLKTVEVFTDTGWTAIVWDWCGTGAEQQLLLPHSNAEIIAPAIRRNIKTRVRFSIAQAPNGEYRMLSSNEFIIP